MIAEPYICKRGMRAGDIMWCVIKSYDDCGSDLCSGKCKDGCIVCAGGEWIPYVDFERKKLEQLHGRFYIEPIEPYFAGSAYSIILGNSNLESKTYYSYACIAYSRKDYEEDSEAHRLIMRSFLLMYVCSNEGVEWLHSRERKTCEFCGQSTDWWDNCCNKWTTKYKTPNISVVSGKHCNCGKNDCLYACACAGPLEWRFRRIERKLKAIIY